MKLLIISDFAAPYRKAVFSGLGKEYETDVFFNIAKSEQRDPKWYVRSDKEFRFYVLSSEEAFKKYDECIKNIESYDAVLCYDPWASRSRALQRLCMRKGIPYVLNADGARGINMSFPKKQVKSFYTKRAPMLFAGCERAVEYFKAYGARDERIRKHNFSSIFADQIVERPYSEEEKRNFKTELGMEQRTTFMAVGQFIHRKGFDILLNAWAETDMEKGQLYIIGGGPLRGEYEEIIKNKSLKNVYIEDFKKPDELLRYYRASDVFLMPTREDIWGLVVNEAMAEGLPIITSDECTSGVELIENDRNGYVYKCEDYKALAGHIEKMMDEPQRIRQLSEKAIEAIRPYTLESIVEGHLKNIRELIDKSAKKEKRK